MTDVPKKGRTAVTMGPTGRTVAANILRLRMRSLMTTRALADRLATAGRPISQSSITRMERGEKNVTTDDLAALAAVFQVSPAALLLPLDDDPDTAVDITGAGEISADAAWSWASNERPLVVGEHETAFLEYALLSLPTRRRGEWMRRVGVEA
jgi:transcriptional regulator with XRE-family HTH domain